MTNLNEDFLLIYLAKTQIVKYEELLAFLGCNFSDLIKTLEIFTFQELIKFEDGRFSVTENGIQRIAEYDTDVFDFTNGINLINVQDRFLFKNIQYLPNDFYKKYKV